jgi:hypothetical protein
MTFRIVLEVVEEESLVEPKTPVKLPEPPADIEGSPSPSPENLRLQEESGQKLKHPFKGETSAMRYCAYSPAVSKPLEIAETIVECQDLEPSLGEAHTGEEEWFEVCWS